jgi:hypothetical protein
MRDGIPTAVKAVGGGIVTAAAHQKPALTEREYRRSHRWPALPI